MESTLPDEVVQFVRKYIQSLDQLEALLLVSALPDRAWAVPAVDAVIRSNPEAIRRWLIGFVQAGLLSWSEQEDLYRYQPANPQLDNAVATLGAAYKTSRHRVIALVYSADPSQITAFSDAFRFRKQE